MSKKIVENCRILTTSYLRSRGLLPSKDLEPVKSLQFDWDKDDMEICVAKIRVDLFETSAGQSGMMYLDCIFPPSGVIQTQEVRLATTTPNYGGLRYWFVCPCYRGGGNGHFCNRKVQKLYLPSGACEFGCRRCHRLAYAAENESRPDRDGSILWGRIMRLTYGKDWIDKIQDISK